MRHPVIVATLLIAVAATSLAAQRTGRNTSRPDRSDNDRSSSSSTRDVERFTPDLRSGQRFDVANIDGDISIVQARGTSAEVVATRRMRRGDAQRIRAVLERTSDGYRLCTVYLDRADDEASCNDRRRHNGNRDDDDRLDGSIAYEIRVPSGVELAVNSVDGNITARGIDVAARLQTVDGEIQYEGVAPRGLTTVDGTVRAEISNGRWDHDVVIHTVDGDVSLTLPRNASLDVSGQSVDGDVQSDFPITMAGRFGPRSFRGTIGGGGARLTINTVDGSIHIHQAGRD